MPDWIFLVKMSKLGGVQGMRNFWLKHNWNRSCFDTYHRSDGSDSQNNWFCPSCFYLSLSIRFYQAYCRKSLKDKIKFIFSQFITNFCFSSWLTKLPKFQNATYIYSLFYNSKFSSCLSSLAKCKNRTHRNENHATLFCLNIAILVSFWWIFYLLLL